MKKNFFPYLPAKLIQGVKYWYILFYQTDPTDGKRKRIRQTFGLNRISDIGNRKKMAAEIITRINRLLPKGYPYLIDFNGFSFLPSKPTTHYFKTIDQLETAPKLSETNILEALELARKIHCQTDRKETINCYNSHVRLFCKYLKKKKLHRLSIGEFSPKMAGEYMDYWILEKEVSNVTYNNKLTIIRILFKTLLVREYISENPFQRIARKKKAPKKRRNFTAEERNIVAAHIKANDFWMYYALLFQYYCFIRPAEMRRLRFRNLDLHKGIIQLTEDISKNRDADTVTIPGFLMTDFRHPQFIDYPINYYIFGAGMRPHPRHPCSKNMMNERHRKFLRELKKEGKLKDITGLSWYSWKDTGLTDFARIIQPRDLQEQVRHSSLEMTEKYLHGSEVIESIRNLKERVI